MNLLVVVDVTLSIGVGLLRCLERNADEVFTQNIVEDAGTQAAVLLYHVVSKAHNNDS
jgi:arginyl-tRNA synthetase